MKEPASATAVPSCPEKERLLREFTVATSDYTRAVALLDEKIGVLPKTDYQRLSRYADEARRRSEETRAALNRHVEAHGCWKKLSAFGYQLLAIGFWL